jgi:drug/metabolite transporter (DMT)-like permease
MAKFIPFILFTVFTNAAAQVMLKKGMTAIGAFTIDHHNMIQTVFRIVFHPWVFFGLVTFVISMASHLFVLSRVDVSFAYPFLSIAYVLVAVYAYFFLGENVNAMQIAGILLICGGTVMISMKSGLPVA